MFFAAGTTKFPLVGQLKNYSILFPIVYFWLIGMMDVKSGLIVQLLPPLRSVSLVPRSAKRGECADFREGIRAWC